MTSTPVFIGIRVAHLFNFFMLCLTVCFGCFWPVAGVSGLSILDCPIMFSLTFIVKTDCVPISNNNEIV